MNPYLSEDQIDRIFNKLQIDLDGLDDGIETKNEIVNEATGEMEINLSSRFVVPLVGESNIPFSSLPETYKSNIQRLLKLLIEKQIALEFSSNTGDEDSSITYNSKSKRAKELVTALLDKKRKFPFKLADFAQEFQPTEVISLARPQTDYQIG